MNKNKNETGIIFNRRGYTVSDLNITALIVRFIFTALSVYLIIRIGFEGFNIKTDMELILKIDLIASFILVLADIYIIPSAIVNCGLLYMIYCYISENKELLKNGILSIMNEAYPVVRASFSLPEADGFDKVMQNSDMTINMVACILTLLFVMIIAFVIGRLMSKILYGAVISILLGVLGITGCDINKKFVFILLLIFICIFFADMGGNTSAALGNRFRRRGKHCFVKHGDSLYMVQLCIIAAVVGTILLYAVSGIYSKESFDNSFKTNYSDDLKVTVRDIAVMKYVEYKKFGNQNSFDMGQVGYQSYFKPTAKKIKTISVKPEANESTLVKEFTGQNYVYRMNMWTDGENNQDINSYLTIDDNNKDIIDKICREQNFEASDDIAKAVSDYLINNYTFSIDAEILPYGKDFVNSFLEESKKGNASHYASAAVLIFRNLGIPARYVSGYKIDYEQALTGKYNRKNGEFDVDVSGANAYAWAEIYDNEKGWTAINVCDTPPIEELKEQIDSNDKSDVPDTNIDSYFRTVDKSKYSADNIKRILTDILLKIVLLIVVIIGLLLAGKFLYRYVRTLVIYINGDNSRKASMLIERYCKRANIDTNSMRELKKCIIEKGNSSKTADSLVSLAEKIIFSPDSDSSDIRKLNKIIKSLKK